MKLFSLLLVCSVFATTFVTSCSEEEKVAKLKAPLEKKQPVKAKAFAPPANGKIDSVTVAKYIRTTKALLILDESYSVRLRKGDANEKLKVISEMNDARDRICRNNGLAGAKEYNWLDAIALKKPVNQAIVRKAGIDIAK